MAFLSDVSVPRMHCLRPGNATGPDSEWRNSTRRCFSDNRAGHVRGRGVSVFVMGAPGSVSERRKTFRFTQIFSHLLAEQLSPRSLSPSLPLSSLLPLLLPCLTQLIETLNGKIRLCPILPAFLFLFFEQLIGCVDAVLCCFLKAVSGQQGLEAAHLHLLL